MRKFRFGVTGRGDTLAAWRDFARKAESLGYDTLVLPDHFARQLAPIPALIAAAQVTSTLRLGTLVLDNDFRHPASLAKELATLDLLSEGRLEVGIGTGSQPRDNEQAGIPLDPPGKRFERLRETLAILDACFSSDEVNFDGTHYQLKAFMSYPRPVQPRVPLMLGARGPRMLRLAGRRADIIGVMGGPESNHAEQLEVVRAAAGQRFESIEFNQLYLQVDVDGQRSGLPGNRLPALVGSHEQIVEQLLAQREQELISYVVVIGTAIDAFAPIVARLRGT
ncbi:MAG: TIGR03621 family F420-dependent LLM class oxidoreductase [Chloroflexi bacterium]|nr:TIGR03621 family F420-dependent LLM class oxidoreductase [Chloroflexota bacterium]